MFGIGYVFITVEQQRHTVAPGDNGKFRINARGSVAAVERYLEDKRMHSGGAVDRAERRQRRRVGILPAVKFIQLQFVSA